jgi:hypothetical protein
VQLRICHRDLGVQTVSVERAQADAGLLLLPRRGELAVRCTDVEAAQWLEPLDRFTDRLANPRLGREAARQPAAKDSDLSSWSLLTPALPSSALRHRCPKSLGHGTGPTAPPTDLSGSLQRRLELAHLALGRLDSVTTLLPGTSFFLYSYIRKEAVLSSQIEGTQSSLSDVLLFELEQAPGVPVDDVVEVANYVAAMEHGLSRLREGMPLSNRLIREIHGHLLSRGRGSDKQPGQFRTSQNGSAARGPATLPSCRRPQISFLLVPVSWSSSCTERTTVCRHSFAPRWRMCSSRPSIRSWTATAASVAC